MIDTMILEEAIKKAKEELLLKLESGTSGTGSALAQLKASLEEKLSPWTGTRAAKLDNLDAKVSSRADGSYYTPGRASKLDKLDKLDTTVSSRLSKADFYAWDSANGTVLDDLKKSSAEYRDRIAAVLGQMDAAGLSTGDSIKLLTQYLEGIPIIGAASSTLTTQGSSYTMPRGYHNGNGSVRTNITNLRPENIKSGANVGGVVGTHAPQVRIEYYEVPNERIETKSLGGTICYVCLPYSDGSYTFERELESKPIGYTLYLSGPTYPKFVSENESWNSARIKKLSEDKLEAYMNGGRFSFLIARRYD